MVFSYRPQRHRLRGPSCQSHFALIAPISSLQCALWSSALEGEDCNGHYTAAHAHLGDIAYRM
jgi:hypothetical protein